MAGEDHAEDGTGRAAPLARILGDTYDAENHATLGNDLTRLMVQLSVEPPPRIDLAPPRERRPVVDLLARLLRAVRKR